MRRHLECLAARSVSILPVKRSSFWEKMLLGGVGTRRYRIRMEIANLIRSRLARMPQHQRAIFRGIFVGLFALIAVRFDLSIAGLCVSEHVPGDLRRILGLAEIFAHGAGVVLIGWCIWHLAPQRRRCLPRLAACAFMPGLVANLLKISLCRLRPIYFGEQLPNSIWDSWIATLPNVFTTRAEYGTYFASSFPSGHATTAFGLAIGLSWVFPQGRWPFYSIAVLAAAQRIVSGAHWFSDTLFGLALAMLIAGSLTSNSRFAKLFVRIETPRPVKSQADQFRRVA